MSAHENVVGKKSCIKRQKSYLLSKQRVFERTLAVLKRQRKCFSKNVLSFNFYVILIHEVYSKNIE